VALREPGASAVIYGGMNAAASHFDGVTEALAAPGIDIRLFGKPKASPAAAWAWRSPLRPRPMPRVTAPKQRRPASSL